ncbi:hypothetical protein [Spongiivirga citrea]|uniref:Uncharacterized protein n=1 Tax=Spongiivirga citrea TaxID=1481457 RepID=A0A6M0CLS7_9FLAO|nr:hypothetical protein [Spongiivirga citrea]NER17933.1 hypothetical protein [Spongiivirga citrea]
MGKRHLFRIIGIGFTLLLIVVYFMLNPAKDTSTIDDNKQVLDSINLINSSDTPEYVDLDTLQIIHLKYK